MTAPRHRQTDGRVHGVVVACRDSAGRYLCIRRSATVAAPLKVCFPGGAMEPGETQPMTAVREMREELGVDIEPIDCVWRWQSPTSMLTLWGWTAAAPATAPVPDPAEVAEVHWLTPAEIVEHPDAMPTNRAFVEALLGNSAC